MVDEIGKWRVIVNYHSCEGKQTCIDVCPTDVFVMQPTRVRHPLFWLKIKVHGGKQAVPVNEDACIGCMECVKVCPELAIGVDAVPG
jgi:NAD-dependent dihydropyrimidine dehydrogenase PreA subunit